MKAVILEGKKIGEALTLRQAAVIAMKNGVPVDPDFNGSIVQFIGESPRAFNCVREAGQRIP